MTPITINSKLGSGNGVRQDLGTSDGYFPSKSYLGVKYGQEILHSVSVLNMACYRKSSCKHSLSALLLYTGGGLFPSDTDQVNRNAIS